MQVMQQTAVREPCVKDICYIRNWYFMKVYHGRNQYFFPKTEFYIIYYPKRFQKQNRYSTANFLVPIPCTFKWNVQWSKKEDGKYLH